MWPWGHLAVGYLLYSAFARWRFDRPPGDGPTLVVLFGTQFPDLVDKPLAWTVHLLPSGRSLGHSLITATVCCALLFWVARRRGRSKLAIAFAVGYVSHLVADAIVPLVNGQYRYIAYLGWPLLELPPYDTGIGFVERFVGFAFTPFVLFQFALVALALVVWFHDGRPGLARLRGWLDSRRRATEH